MTRQTLLFDIHTDYTQQQPIDDPELEKRMLEKLIAAMKRANAPEEQYERLGLCLS